jgi:hypothetical protein
MSNLAHRWFCRECKREWIKPEEYYANSAPVSITGNPLNSKNCIACGSPEIELVEFRPQFPGLDIPREQINKVIPIQHVETIKGLTTKDDHEISVRNIHKFEIPTPLIQEGKSDPIIEIPEPIPETDNKLKAAMQDIEMNPIFDLSDMD